MTSREIDSQAILDGSIGENLDRLITLDMRGDEIGRVVYRAARALTTEPLSMAGARFLLGRLPPNGTALFLTGFRIPPGGMPETDGLIGSAILAFALVQTRTALPVFVCEPEVTSALSAAIRATGLAVVNSLALARTLPLTTAIIAFRTDEPDPEGTALRLATEITPAACIAIERAGRNAQGHYHFAGGTNVSPSIASIDSLFVVLSESGVPTLAVGDFGNELGMGAISDVVKAETPAGNDCGCGCGGGTACEIVADMTVACTISDWGAYAISAAISHLEANPSAFVGVDVYRRVIEATVAAGAVDGPSLLAVPHIDGVRDEFNLRLIEQMRDVVAYPSRPQMDNEFRKYRAKRDSLHGSKNWPLEKDSNERKAID